MTHYSNEHVWVRREADGTWTAGITGHAQDTLGEIVAVELPAIQRHEQGQAIGLIESSKTASDLYMPLGGTVTAVNTALLEAPDKINSDPLGEGWIFKLERVDEGDCARLMDAAAYAEMVG